MEWNRAIFVSQIYIKATLLSYAYGKIRPEKCNRCNKLRLACLGHMGFTPCVACKQVGHGCKTGLLFALDYHASLVQKKIIVYDDDCDFYKSRKVKLEVRKRYANAKSKVSRSPEMEKLLGVMEKLCEDMEHMKVDVHGMRGGIHHIMEELQRVPGRDISVATPPDEPSSSAQPTSNPYGLESAYPATPTVDNWQCSTNAPMETSEWLLPTALPRTDTNSYQFPAVPEVGTSGTSDAHADDIMYGPYVQDDLGLEYVEGSSTGMSVRERDFRWQQGNFFDGDSAGND